MGRRRTKKIDSLESGTRRERKVLLDDEDRIIEEDMKAKEKRRRRKEGRQFCLRKGCKDGVAWYYDHYFNQNFQIPMLLIKCLRNSTG